MKLSSLGLSVLPSRFFLTENIDNLGYCPASLHTVADPEICPRGIPMTSETSGPMRRPSDFD